MLKKSEKLELYTIMSVLGYCLLPFVVLATATLVIDVTNAIGYAVCAGIIMWSTYMATKFIDIMVEIQGKKMLIAYPVALFYMCFLLLTIF